MPKCTKLHCTGEFPTSDTFNKCPAQAEYDGVREKNPGVNDFASAICKSKFPRSPENGRSSRRKLSLPSPKTTGATGALGHLS